MPFDIDRPTYDPIRPHYVDEEEWERSVSEWGYISPWISPGGPIFFDVNIIERVIPLMKYNIYRGIDKEGKERRYKSFDDSLGSEVKNSVNYNFVKTAALYKHLRNCNPGISEVEIGPGYISTSSEERYITAESGHMDVIDEEGNIIPQDVGTAYKIRDELRDFASLLATLDLLHKDNVALLQLNPDRLVRGEDGLIKICDLQGARYIQTDELETFEASKAEYLKRGRAALKDIKYVAMSNGTYYYNPPECNARPVASAGYISQTAVDIWCLGCIFYQLLTGYRFEHRAVRKWLNDNIFSIECLFEIIPEPYEAYAYMSEDMNREGFSVFSVDWESDKRRILERLNPKYTSDVSHLDFILQQQRKITGELSDDDISDINEIWDMLRRMLDPNPLTRISASECLDLPIFSKYSDVLSINTYFNTEYKRRKATYEPLVKIAPLDGGIYRKLMHLLSKDEFPDGVGFVMKENPKLYEEFKRISLAIDKKIKNISANLSIVDKYIYICVAHLALYSGRMFFHGETGILWYEIANMMYDGEIEKVRKYYFKKFRGTMDELRKRIYMTMYFLLVNILEFNLWS